MRYVSSLYLGKLQNTDTGGKYTCNGWNKLAFYVQSSRGVSVPLCISREFMFPPVGSLYRLLVLVTLGWLGLVTVQSPCSAQLSFKHGCWSEAVYHRAEVGDSGLTLWKTLLPRRHHGHSESEISRPLWCWTAKESNNVGAGNALSQQAVWKTVHEATDG
jgi:hypothetical protein